MMSEDRIDDLTSADPETAINGALWIIHNPDKLEKIREYHMKASSLLFSACVEDPECVDYINDQLQDMVFKAQLFARVLQEGQDQEIKDTARNILTELVDKIHTTDDSDLVAEIYSCLKESGDAEIMEKAQSLL